MEVTLLESNARPMHILPLLSHQLKELVFGNVLTLIIYWSRGIKFSKRIANIEKKYEYLAVDELLLNFPLEGTNVSARRLLHESLLFAEKNNLFKNFSHYSESDRGNGEILTCRGYSVATIWAENNVFYSIDTVGIHMDYITLMDELCFLVFLLLAH